MSGVNHVTATALGGVGSLGRHANLVLRTARPVQGSSTLCEAWNRLSTEDRSYGPIQFRGIAPSSLSGHAVLCKKVEVELVECHLLAQPLLNILPERPQDIIQLCPYALAIYVEVPPP